MKREAWKPVADWPYEVSSQGRVRRAAPGGGGHHGVTNTYVGRVLKPNTDRDGYRYVRLCRGGKTRDFKVHVLVCRAFHGEPPSPKHEVRHLNRNRKQNAPGNLTWGTRRDNAADRDRHGTTRRGERAVRAKLTQAQVDEIRRRHREALVGRQRVPRGFIQQLAAEYGMSGWGITTIVSGRGYQ